jgi:hypothetical protein
MHFNNFCKVALFILFLLTTFLGCYASGTHRYSAELLPIVKGFKFGYINRYGRIIVKPQFDSASDFSDGMGRFEKNGKQGFIDSSGKIVIKPQFNQAHDFSDGLAAVTIPDGTCELCGETVYINKLGKVIIHTRPLGAKQSYASDFSEGLAGFCIEDKMKSIEELLPYGYIDKTGKILIAPKFGDVSEFHEGLAAFAKDYMRRSGYGYINQKGEIVIEPQFAEAGEFHEGLASVRINGKYGYIDKTGKFLIEPKFDDASSFSEGYALVKVNNKYGYIDKTGQIIIAPQFEWAWDFSEGLAPARTENKIGYINRKGIFVIPPKFEEVDYEGFSGGVAKIYETYKIDYPSKIGYIDKTGKYIWKPSI